jgi:hypothetical protein
LASYLFQFVENNFDAINKDHLSASNHLMDIWHAWLGYIAGYLATKQVIVSCYAPMDLNN